MNNTEIIAASCQRLAVQWLDTLRIGGILLASFILLAVTLRIFAIIYLTSTKKHQIENSSSKKLPKWLIKFAKNQNFPDSKIKIDKKNQKYSAYTLGLFHPVIVISRKLVKKADKKEVEAILLHEIYHFRKLHTLRIAAANLIAEIFFFLPAINDFSKQFSIYCEQSADRFVVKEQKTNLYLLKALRHSLSEVPEDSNLVVMAAFAAKNVENRIAAIQEKRFILDFPAVKNHLISLSILILFGVLAVSSQKIEASVSGQILSNSFADSCNVWQCASSCFSQNEYFTPNTNQSEL